MKVCLAAARSGLTRLQAPAVRKPARNGSTPVPSCTRHLEPSGTSRMELCVGRDSSTSTLAWASDSQYANPGAWNSRHKRSTYSRSEEHTSELQSRGHLVCRLLLEKKK